MTEPKPTEAIALKVLSPDGDLTEFRLKRTTPLEKLMSAYCTKIGVGRTTRRFMIDGNFIKDSDTPDKLKLQNDDIIDVVMEQQGGGM